MPLDLATAEKILKATPGLQIIYDQMYELSFKSSHGRQIGINRRALSNIGIWIEAVINPHMLGLSGSASVKHYPPTKPRAHLSAPRLTGPYKSRLGNDCWYVTLREEADIRLLLSAYV